MGRKDDEEEAWVVGCHSNRLEQDVCSCCLLFNCWNIHIYNFGNHVMKPKHLLVFQLLVIESFLNSKPRLLYCCVVGLPLKQC